MYQAIVFLPLLGSILAAFIALAGAHARHPGGPPSDDTQSHGVGQTADQAHHAPAPAPAPAAGHGAAAVHSSGHEPPAAPAAGSRSAELITTTLLFFSMVLSWIAFARVGFGHQDARESIMPFIVSGDLKVDWALRIDALTAVMLVVVTTVSAFVHLYSIGYMEEDPHRPRFFSYLSLFTFAMLMLVSCSCSSAGRASAS
jgi:NADH-quinone oxidoreductase subunit L